ncbi:hypothetical protein shn_05860 [Shinella sp. HZN7]|jgi:hypothetical protein|nr:hypothetical protein shn_05860 [Shinella sp. HZN7]
MNELGKRIAYLYFAGTIVLILLPLLAFSGVAPVSAAHPLVVFASLAAAAMFVCVGVIVRRGNKNL